MNKTKIEWVKNPDGTQGHTWNPITGCLNRTPEGLCLGGNFPCYAYRLANGRLKSRYLANENIAPSFMNINHILDADHRLESGYADPFYPRFWEDKLLELRTRKPRYQTITKSKGIFVCDMSDLFGIGIPEEWTQRVMEAIRACPQHRFYLLTKQPQNLVKWDFPDNCWVGVSVTNNDQLYNAMKSAQFLAQIEAKIKYISFEPLLERIEPSIIGSPSLPVDWVIIGSQTKPYKPPKIEWVEEIVEACDKAGIPVFLKKNLVPILPILQPFYTSHSLPEGGFTYNYPRQEMPKIDAGRLLAARLVP